MLVMTVLFHFVSDDDPSNLVDALGGFPDTGGSWSPSLVSGGGIFDPSTDMAGVYTYTVIGCDTSTATVSVTIDSALNAGKDGNLSLCSTDDAVNLLNSLGGNPDQGGSWTPALSNSNPNIFDPAVDESGTYTYTVTGPSGCSDSQADVVVTVAMCTVTLDLDEDNSSGASGSDFQDDLVCPKSSVNIADIDVDIATDAFIDSIVIALTGGIQDGSNEYLVIEQLQNFVFNDSSQKVTVKPDITLNINDLESLISGVSYHNEASPFSIGDRIITVTVFNQDGNSSAESTISLTINLSDAGIDNLIQIVNTDPPFNLFESLGGTPDPGGFWIPSLSSNANLFDPSVESSGEYLYVVSNDCDSDSAILTVEIEEVMNDSCNLESLFIPNAFSPNGDQNNDELNLNILGEYDRLDFRIYNRWGELVFETQDISIGWDGVFNGELQSTDVFGYVVEIECSGSTVQKQGNITLLR